MVKGLREDLDACAKELQAAADLQGPTPSGKPWSAITRLPEWLARLDAAAMPERLLANMWQGGRDRRGLGTVLVAWLLLHDLGRQLGLADDRQCLELMQRFGLDFAWRESASSLAEQTDVFLGMLLLQVSPVTPHPATSEPAFIELVNNPRLAGLLGINTHAGQSWFSREGLAALAGAVALQATLTARLSPCAVAVPEAAESLIPERLRERLARAAAVGYRLDKFMQLG
jgi:hypothetical protein